MRRVAQYLVLAALLNLAAANVVAEAPGLTPQQRLADFDTAWRAIDERYAYFNGNRAAWKRAGASARGHAMRASDRESFVASLEAMLAELADDHVSLSERTARAPRALPQESDIWARWQDGAAVVEAVRAFSDADVAGVRPGQVITKIQGVEIDRALHERLRGKTVGAASRDRALRQLLAGPRHGVFRLEVRGSARPLEIERRANGDGGGQAGLVARRVGDERDLGYIRIRDVARLGEEFDGALHSLRDTRGLIVDLRETSGPGSRALTEGILGRFAAESAPWQLRQPRGAARITDKVTPREPPYRAPVLVLVDRWTAGEAETLAVGLRSIARARLVGTRMAGLHGEVNEIQLPHSGLRARFPAERVYLMDGTAREDVRPDVEVDLAAPSGGPGDPILYQALKLLERR